MRRSASTALMAMLLLAGGRTALAQQTGTITGTVTGAEDGRPIENARIGVRGASVSTLTRADGRYTLAVRAGTYTVLVRRLGFTPDSTTGVVVPAGGTATADFRVRQAANVLQDVVVTVPYTSGSQSGREQTGAVASVTPKEFNTGRIVSPEQLIRGKIAGVQVVDNNEPGGGIAIRVRGGTSVSASNDPLYVVDGVPLVIGGGASSGRNPLNFLNPQDVENITVLKDASATAIYGTRGANGVVLITTRRGQSGPQFAYNVSVSSSKATSGPDMLDAAQFKAATQKYAGTTNLPLLGGTNTDWLTAIEQTGTGIEHDLSANGRRQDAAYHLGLDYLDQKGVLRGTRTQRAAATVNYSDRLLNGTLGLRSSIKGSREKDFYTPNSVLGEAVAMPSTQPILTDPTHYFQWSNTLGTNNPIADLNQIEDQGTVLRSIGSLEGEYMIPYVDGLSATLRGSYDVVNTDRTTFTPSYVQSQVELGTNPGNFNRNLPSQLNTVLDAFAHYTRRFDQYASDFDVTGGYSTERFRGDYASFYAQGLSTNLLGLNGVPTANDTRPFYSIDESRLISTFGRFNYTLRDRYLFTATVRRDGSSKFGPGHQWGTFPSVAFAWRAIEESFVKEHTPLSDLKARVSWGLNGNQSLPGNYFAYTSYTVGQSTAQAQFGNQFITTIRPSGSDPNLHWEKTASVDAGIDYGFLGNRVSGSIDYYNKKTTDLLFDVPTAAGTSLSNHFYTNIGSVRNQGWEFAVNTTPIDAGGARGGLTWTANFIASTNRNTLLTIDRPGLTTILNPNSLIAGGVGTYIEVLRPGAPVNSFFVYEHKTVNGRPVADSTTSVKLTDMYVDRNNDGVINQDDRRAFHSPAPKWILGHTSTVTWHGFDAATTLRAYVGNYVYNNVASNLGHYSLVQLNGAPTNLNASVLKTNYFNQQVLSDVYVEDASFIRMDNLTLGYTFDRLANLRGTRLFGTIQNVFTTTKYTGIDPTAGLGGIDNNIYPRSRTFLVGAAVGF